MSRLQAVTLPSSPRLMSPSAETLPGALVLLAIVPPREAIGKVVMSQRHGLGVLFAPLRSGLLVVPDLPGRTRGVEENQVGWDVGVGGEHALRQADHRVEVEPLQQVGLDPRADAVAEQRSVRDDHRGPDRARRV